MSETKASENKDQVNPSEHLRKLNDQIAIEKISIESLKKEIGQLVIGQSDMIDALIVALLTEGHILLEGLPGLAKTLAVKTLSEAISVDFSRIQFTPDLLPADVTGTMIYQQKSESLRFVKDLFSHRLYWLMKSIGLRLRFKVLYWKRCRNVRLPLEKNHSNYQTHFW
jgi:MoxR-like ATPase